MAVDAMLAQVQSDMQSAAAQVQAATDYANSLPPLPNFGQQTTPRPLVQWGCPISRLRLYQRPLIRTHEPSLEGR